MIELKKGTLKDTSILKMKRESAALLSSWQLNDLIESITENYYKYNLLNEIYNEIKSGTSLSDIFIMQKSFTINNKYNDIENISLKTTQGVKAFYHLGEPVSLRFSSDISMCNKVFVLYRYLFSIGGPELKKISKDEIKKYLDISELKGIENSLNQMLMDYKELNLKQNKSLLKSTQINRIEKRVETLLEEYHIEQELEKNNSELLLKIEKQEYYVFNKKIENEKEFLSVKKMINKANNHFKRFSRPIIGVYDGEKKEIRILAFNFLDKNYQNEDNKDFLNITNISHNSPYVVDITMGMIVGSALVLAAVQRALVLNRKENAKRNGTLDLDIIELEIMEKQIMRDNEIENIQASIYGSTILNNDEKAILLKIAHRCEYGLEKTLNNYNFFLDNDE